jgi:hypothetical protein
MRRGIKEKSGTGERSMRKEGKGWRREKHPRPPLKVNSIDSHIKR